MKFTASASMAILLLGATEALALDLDWSGLFRTDYHYISNYSLDHFNITYDATRAAAGGYYVPVSGSNDASFATLFLKLRPRVIVNDNISIKSDWWVGDPAYSFFGSSAPRMGQQRFFNSTYSRGSLITAQRLWGELLTDFGTIQVGRAPLHWGLGVVWNQGDGLWDRFASTGDQVRLISKFSSFTFSPALVYYSAGNTFGGSCNVTGGPGTYACTPQSGGASLTDYSFSLKYHNMDEDFEGGLNFIHRLSTGYLDEGYRSPGVGGIGMNYNTWDLYAKKRLGKFTFGGEVPLISGSVGGVKYSTFAVAGELGFKPGDTWEFTLKGGNAPGQGNELPATGYLTGYKGFYFHPNYKLGMIMFNYALFNMGGINTQNNANLSENQVVSPFDHAIANAKYASLLTEMHSDKWTFHFGGVFAQANTSAAKGMYFFNTWQRRISSVLAREKQSKALGFEIDLGTRFRWDDSLTFKFDLGFFVPGAFHKFSNTGAGNDNARAPLLAASTGLAVTF